jgi:hypothetical protein
MWLLGKVQFWVFIKGKPKMYGIMWWWIMQNLDTCLDLMCMWNIMCMTEKCSAFHSVLCMHWSPSAIASITPYIHIWVDGSRLKIVWPLEVAWHQAIEIIMSDKARFQKKHFKETDEERERIFWCWYHHLALKWTDISDEYIVSTTHEDRIIEVEGSDTWEDRACTYFPL